MLTRIQSTTPFFRGHKEISTTSMVAATTGDSENIGYLKFISDLVGNSNSELNVKDYSKDGFSLYSVLNNKFKSVKIDYEIENEPHLSRDVYIRYSDRPIKGYNNSSVNHSETYRLGIDRADKGIEPQIVDFLKSLLKKTDIWSEVEKKYLDVWKLK